MKQLFMIFLFLAVKLFSFDYIESFPDESFKGEGIWSDSLGGHGRYDTFVAFDNDSIFTKYNFPAGEIGLSLDFLFRPQGWFDVGFAGQIVGGGFCMHHQCQYEIVLEGAKINETLTLNSNSLYRVGSKVLPDRVVRWEDRLNPADHVSIPEDPDHQ